LKDTGKDIAGKDSNNIPAGRNNHDERCLLGMLLFASCAALAQSTPASVSSLAWMTGTWTQSSERETESEEWLGPANWLMVATNLSTWPSGKKPFQFRARTDLMLR
jgi:hypothetical protein